jgi:hypothetical protein
MFFIIPIPPTKVKKKITPAQKRRCASSTIPNSPFFVCYVSGERASFVAEDV